MFVIRWDGDDMRIGWERLHHNCVFGLMIIGCRSIARWGSHQVSIRWAHSKVVYFGGDFDESL